MTFNPNDPTYCKIKLSKAISATRYTVLVNWMRDDDWSASALTAIALNGWSHADLGRDANHRVMSTTVAEETMRAAEGLFASFSGRRTEDGFLVCDIWIDEHGGGYVPLGEVLSEIKAVEREP